MTDSQHPDLSPSSAAQTGDQTPRPTPPKPSPTSMPGARPRPQAPAAGPTPPAAPAVTPPSADLPGQAELDEARRHGEADENGEVYVLIQGERHHVGSYPDASPEEALTYFARKYTETQAQLVLLERRVEHRAPAAETRRAAEHLRELIGQRHMVGDLPALEERLDAVDQRIAERAEQEQAEAEQARQEAWSQREGIVEAAEELAAQDSEQTHWKNSTARMNELFETWKQVQRTHRLPKSVEDPLWKRFRTARTAFDKKRRAFFAALDQTSAQAKRVKEGLIAEAEKLSTSTDWGETSRRYRELMDRWKQAPRGSRKVDDALWARFRAAQDVFFEARAAAQEQTEQQFAENLKVKLGLLDQARALLPVTDPEAARRSLQPILEAWDEAGMVPRKDLNRVEGELQKVQDTIAEAEQEQWRRSDPETQARAHSMLSQLEDALAELREQLAQAEASGDERAAASAREALEAREAWYEQLRASSEG